MEDKAEVLPVDQIRRIDTIGVRDNTGKIFRQFNLTLLSVVQLAGICPHLRAMFSISQPSAGSRVTGLFRTASGQIPCEQVPLPRAIIWPGRLDKHRFCCGRCLRTG